MSAGHNCWWLVPVFIYTECKSVSSSLFPVVFVSSLYLPPNLDIDVYVTSITWLTSLIGVSKFSLSADPIMDYSVTTRWWQLKINGACKKTSCCVSSSRNMSEFHVYVSNIEIRPKLSPVPCPNCKSYRKRFYKDQKFVLIQENSSNLQMRSNLMYRKTTQI